MSQNEKKLCPDCNAEMNHNADKVDFTAGLEDPEAIDPEFGGVLKEAYTCPECGKNEVWSVPPGG